MLRSDPHGRALTPLDELAFMDICEEDFEDAAPMTASFGSSSPNNVPWDHIDYLLLGVLALTTLLALIRGVYWQGLPAEDALMLLRYARHLAGGFGIVWNIGEHPVEGATDFLYLIVLSGWIKLSHLGPIWATRTLLATCHVFGVVLLYSVSRSVAQSSRLLSFILALYCAVGPGILHTSNGFSSPFYALMALAAWSFACSMLTNITQFKIYGFALFSLLTGLTRPDGVLLAIFMTCALVYALRRAALRPVLITALVFLVLGGAYFIWRFHYFGYLLPNPFYKKGGGHLYFGSLHASITDVLKMLLPFLPFFALGLVMPRARRVTLFSLIPIAGFSFIWVLLNNENNAGMRFQYVVLPFGLLSVSLIAQHLQLHLVPRSSGLLKKLQLPSFALALVSYTVFYFWWNTLFPTPERVGTGPYNIAIGLSKYASRDYTLVATEAGVIPYFSRWRTIDEWGLNDAEIVHNPHGLTSAYLDKSHPVIIMMYSGAGGGDKGDFDRVWRGDPPPSENIKFLMDQASHYAHTHGYVVAARWGIMPCAVNIWYLRRDVPEYEELLSIIRQQPNFHPYDEAALATNFLGDIPPANCSDEKQVINRME